MDELVDALELLADPRKSLRVGDRVKWYTVYLEQYWKFGYGKEPDKAIPRQRKCWSEETVLGIGKNIWCTGKTKPENFAKACHAEIAQLGLWDREGLSLVSCLARGLKVVGRKCELCGHVHD